MPRRTKLDRSELEQTIQELEKLTLMSAESPHDKFKWNYKQWLVQNAKEKAVYMSGPNQVGGKTTTANELIKNYATNVFPEGYDGVRFDRPIEILALSVTMDKTQEVLSDRLFGRWDARGTGIIPSSWFDPDADLVPAPGGKRGMLSQAMLPCFDRKGVIIGKSLIRFMAYSMGAHALQGSTPDVVICDEEPYPKDVFDELEARLNKTRGYLRIFANPTHGNTFCRQKFKSGQFKDYRYVHYTFEDCDHLTEDHKQELDAKYPPGSAERLLRLYGEVPEGKGLIFPVNDQIYSCEEIPIQPHHKAVIGTDLPHTANGYSACALLSHNPQEDLITVHGSWKKAGASRAEFIEQLRRFGGKSIPIAWPHDGMRADGTTTVVERLRQDSALNFMPRHAQYRDGDKWSRSVKPVIDDVYDRMLTGRFQVVRGAQNRDLFEELRDYKTKDGKVARRQEDHIIDGMFKAIMVLPQIKEYGAMLSGVGVPTLPKTGRHKDFFNGSRRAAGWKRRS